MYDTVAFIFVVVVAEARLSAHEIVMPVATFKGLFTATFANRLLHIFLKVLGNSMIVRK